MTLEVILDVVLEDSLKIVLSLISVLITYYVLPIIKTDLVPWLKEKRIYSTVKKFVQAAEKLADAGTIEKKDKSDYVIGLLENNGITVDDTVKAFIESCCKEIDIVVNVTKDEILKEENIEP